MSNRRAAPVEDFVQAITAQLDRAQDLLALKAKTGRPLTFALKDMAVDLHVFWESDADGTLLMRHAGPNEQGASTVRLSFTTITRSMVEENTLSLAADDDPRGLDAVKGTDALDNETRKKLEWAGVRTVGQLKRLGKETDARQVGAYLGIPVMRLQEALRQASKPKVTGHEMVSRPDGRRLLRVHGANLTADDPPEVRLSGEAVEVVEAGPSTLLVKPLAHHDEGQVEVVVGTERALGFYKIERPNGAPRRSEETTT
jgi:hypothetical protein